MLFKIKTIVRRFLSRSLQFHRPASYPYLSGDGFRAIANFVYDQFVDFDPSKVMRGDIVFVRTNHLHDFFAKVHPQISESYVLVSNNDDSTVGPEFAKYIDGKILHWYAENLNFKHPKVAILPIGVQNFILGHDENFLHAFLKIKSNTTEPVEKQDRILFGFTDNESVAERSAAHTALSNSKIADHVLLPRSEYYKKLNTYEFVASPRGGGLDCHRTWEALYFKVIPILLRSDFSEQIAGLGFPVLIVDQWSDVEKIDSKYLSDYYAQNRKLFDIPELYLHSWFEKFIKHKNL